MKKHFNFADMIEMVAEAVPEREALVCGDQRVTYAEMDERATRLANYLKAQGVGAGEHVGLYLYNCVEYLEAMYACFKIRAVPINVNYRYVKDELLYIFDNADMVALVHGREFVPFIEEVKSAAPKLRTYVYVEDGSSEAPASIGAVSYSDAIAQGSTDRDFGERSDDDLFMLYTGGTTGMPKGVMWPHKNLFFAAMGGLGFNNPDGPCKTPEEPAERAKNGFPVGAMPLAPLMHGACWWYACIGLLSGYKLVLNHHRTLRGEDVWDLAEKEAVNSITIVGDAMAIPLLDALEANPGRWKLDMLFSVGSGGAVFSESKQEQFKAHFPNVMITNSFGSSESGAMGWDSGDKKKRGSALGNVERSEFMDVLVQNEDGSWRHAEAGGGEEGIFARSGYIPLGYYNAPEKTAETFVMVDDKRWLLTGDSATLEADGSINIYGRGSNCINSGGEKIFPEEVEAALKSHEGVFDALVVATPDERFGNKVTAVVQPREGAELSLDAIQEHCRQHISGYKVPRALHLIDTIPRAPSGKPDYKTAKDHALSGEGQVA